MYLFESVVGVLGAVALGAASPGPSFVFVARTSVAGSRMQGLAAAAGMGVGGVFFAAVAMLGLQTFLFSIPWLFLSMKVGGGLYLIYLAVRMFRGAKTSLVDLGGNAFGSSNAWRAFRGGLLIQLSNPKTAVVYGSIFAALLPRDLSRLMAFVLPGLVFLIEAGWYSIVALILSSLAPRQTYLRWKSTIDRVAGGVMGLLGIKLLISTDSPR
jgi:threonine/homoserine/homoserine lactone efflux protein